ncbi:MAG: hypothetical protein IJ782_01255 [Prevotella sp.]|nr:hypothetical protein [Prevotella sp.]
MEDNLRQRAKSKLLKVTMPSGEIICYNRSSETFLETLRKIGSEHFPDINLTVGGLPFFSKNIYPKFKDTMKEVCDGWYVVMVGGTEGRYIQLRSIAQQLGIDMIVELGEDFVTQKAKVNLKGRKRNNMLLVKFPNGKWTGGKNPINTLIETVVIIGPEKIKRKELLYKGKPIITPSNQFRGQVQVGQNLWLLVPGQTIDKYKMLRIIDAMMKLHLEIFHLHG